MGLQDGAANNRGLRLPKNSSKNSKEMIGRVSDELINRVVCGSCIDLMAILSDNFVDLTVTSPPY